MDTNASTNCHKWLVLKKYYPLGFKPTAKILTQMTCTLIAINLLSLWLMSTISFIFMAQLGPTIFNATSLAFTIYSVLGNSIVMGLNYAADTLFPLYYGSNKFKMSIVLQRGVFFLGFTTLVVMFLFFNARHLLSWIGINENLIVTVEPIIKLYLCLTPFDGLALLLRSYIASTGKLFPVLLMNGIGNFINIIAHCICVYALKIGAQSPPICLTVAYIGINVTAILYIRFSSLYKETWHPIDRSCLEDWTTYAKLAIPGVLTIMIETGSFEISGIFAARISDDSLSAQAVVEQAVWFFQLIMLSIGDSGNILIGQYLGANQTLEARNTKNVTITLASFLVLINTSIIVLFHHWIPGIFNTPKHVKPLARHALLLAMVYAAIDGINITHVSIIKACGLQKYSTVFSLVGFYLLGLPLSYILSFITKLDILGFWLGMIAAVSFICICLVIHVYRINFDHVVKRTNGYTDINDSSHFIRHKNTESHRLLSYQSHDLRDDEEMQIDSFFDQENRITDYRHSVQSLFKLLWFKIMVLLVLIAIVVVSVLFTNS